MLAEKPKKFGALTKRLCSGLQIRLVRFDSGTRLQFFPSPDGGIGRHKGFKIPRRSRCVGSSPTPGTMGKNRIIKAISSVVKPPTGGFFVFVRHIHHCFAIQLRHKKEGITAPRRPEQLKFFDYISLFARRFYDLKFPASHSAYLQDQKFLWLLDHGK